MNLLTECELNGIKNIETEGFKIEDISTVNWAFRKLRALQEVIDEINSLADEDVRRIEKWKAKELKNINDDKEFFEGHLKLYYARVRAENPKAKISTPNGKLSTRKTKEWIYESDEELIDFLKLSGYGNMVNVTEKVDKKALKANFKNGVIDGETGEVLPFINVVDKTKINIKVE